MTSAGSASGQSLAAFMCLDTIVLRMVFHWTGHKTARFLNEACRACNLPTGTVAQLFFEEAFEGGWAETPFHRGVAPLLQDPPTQGVYDLFPETNDPDILMKTYVSWTRTHAFNICRANRAVVYSRPHQLQRNDFYVMGAVYMTICLYLYITWNAEAGWALCELMDGNTLSPGLPQRRMCKCASLPFRDHAPHLCSLLAFLLLLLRGCVL